MSLDTICHEDRHEGPEPYPTDECDQSFSKSSSLIDLKKTQCWEKSFQCNLCVKAFTRLSHLMIHKGMHSRERPYPSVEHNVSLVQQKRNHLPVQ